jgi:uncharacterized membrane protein
VRVLGCYPAYALDMAHRPDERTAAETRRAEAEHRWPAAAAVLVGLALYLLLPSSFAPVLRWILSGAVLALLLPLVALNPRRMSRETAWSRGLGIAFALLLLGANQVALGQLVVRLVGGAEHPGSDGPALLLAALQVWVVNVIAFALVYWELDRGGPVARRHDARADLPPADFRFPQDEDHDAVAEVASRSSRESDWMPGYVDYLYFSASNQMAFSPTDTMPLSHRAKLLMAAQAFIGFALLALVIARAVSLLG